MVGPVAKISDADLPRHSNLHYVGQQSYEDLPEFLGGWDACLLPFALNESTVYISPTKVLEYMVAERPIISTPLTDIASPYGDIVYLAEAPDAFVSQCEAALASDATVRERRTRLMREVLALTSWDRTVASMSNLIAQQMPRRARTAALKEDDAPPVLIIGAGPTGLSAAYHLGDDALLLEQHDRVGGWCRSVTIDGFTFDFAGHIMFSNDPYVHDMYKLLLGDNVHWQDREAWIYSHRVYSRYPFQGALYGLPPEVIKECLIGTIEARFVPLNPTDLAKTNGHSAASRTDTPWLCRKLVASFDLLAGV